LNIFATPPFRTTLEKYAQDFDTQLRRMIEERWPKRQSKPFVEQAKFFFEFKDAEERVRATGNASGDANFFHGPAPVVWFDKGPLEVNWYRLAIHEWEAFYAFDDIQERGLALAIKFKTFVLKHDIVVQLQTALDGSLQQATSHDFQKLP
jgi:hypothetical protein